MDNVEHRKSTEQFPAENILKDEDVKRHGETTALYGDV